MDQTSWISDRRGKLIVDEVLRFETLTDEFNMVVERLDLPGEIKLPLTNASTPFDYRAHYDDEARSIVQRLYSRISRVSATHSDFLARYLIFSPATSAVARPVAGLLRFPDSPEWFLGRFDMPKPLLTVWYNTRCPVCDAGIARQKRRLIEAVKAGRIAFRDINAEPAALAGYGVSLEDIRRRLHATDADGGLLVGADVAIAVWKATPGEGWLATLFGNPVVLPLTRFGYDRFADLLYGWNRRKGRW